MMRRLILVPGLLCILEGLLPAQDMAEVLRQMKVMQDRIQALEKEVETLKSEKTATEKVAVAAPPAIAPPAAPEPLAQPAEPVQLGGAGGAAAKALNPDISVIGDFLGAAGNGGTRGTPALEMHESEAGFQAIIDPYARADFFISFGEKGVNLEEGYLTFTSLPAGLQLRAGKMRAAFGKVNTLHNHVLPWTDRPLVTQNLVAGEDGIDDAGLSLSRILPAPKGIFLEGTAQVFRGDSEGLFQAARRNDVSMVGHLRGYHDLSESTNLDLGFSYARGHSPDSSGVNQLYGIDATLRWKPLRRAIYRSFIARSEFIWGRAQVAPPLGMMGREPLAKPFGYYVSGDYQLGRRWFLGGRFDQSDRLTNTGLQDKGGSVILTYWPSEFSQIRGQLRRTQYGDHMTADEFLFQFQFSMGAHGAHPF